MKPTKGKGGWEVQVDKVFVNTFESKIKRLPKIKIFPIEGDMTTTNYDPLEKHCKIIVKEDVFALTSFSTYAVINGIKTGDPICDRVAIRYYSNCCVCIMTDGCGWRDPSFKAATKAVEGALDYIALNIQLCETVRDIGYLIVSACKHGHINIFSQSESLLNTGTTTITINVIVKTEKGYYLVVVNIGDCRTFYYSPKEHHTLPLTGKYHTSLAHMQDCFGRIGAAQSYDPELKKSELKAFKINPDDIIIISTDGFHENFDPQFMGKEGIKSKEKESDAIMTEMIEQCSNVEEIVESMSNFIVSLTEPSRIYMKENPKKQMPKDLRKYPGKMDHTTVCVIKVGDMLVQQNVSLKSFIPKFNYKIQPDKFIETQLPYLTKTEYGNFRETSPSFLKNEVIVETNRSFQTKGIPTYSSQGITTTVMRDFDVLRSESVGLMQSSLGVETSCVSSELIERSVNMSISMPAPVVEQSHDAIRQKTFSPRTRVTVIRMSEVEEKKRESKKDDGDKSPILSERKRVALFSRRDSIESHERKTSGRETPRGLSENCSPIIFHHH